MNVKTKLDANQLLSCARINGMNLVDHNEYWMPKRQLNNHTFKLRVNDDNDKYLSWNPCTGRKVGRNIPCYHGYYDFYEQLFDLDPNAIVHSGIYFKVVFNGKVDFEAQAEDIKYENMGSMMYPYQYIDACCHE